MDTKSFNKSTPNPRSSTQSYVKSERKPFPKPARNNNCEYGDEDGFSEASDSHSDDADINALNMIEVFNLADDDYSSAIDEVLAARAEQPKHKYNLRSGGGLSKPSTHPQK